MPTNGLPSAFHITLTEFILLGLDSSLQELSGGRVGHLYEIFLGKLTWLLDPSLFIHRMEEGTFSFSRESSCEAPWSVGSTSHRGIILFQSPWVEARARVGTRPSLCKCLRKQKDRTPSRTQLHFALAGSPWSWCSALCIYFETSFDIASAFFWMKQAVLSPPLLLGNMRDAKDATGAQLLRKAECHTLDGTGCPVLQVFWLKFAVGSV